MLLYLATIRIVPKRQSVKKGESASFTCTSTDRINNYLWVLNNQFILSPGVRFSGSKSETITINSVQEGDIGSYSCQGFGSSNMVSATGYLELQTGKLLTTTILHMCKYSMCCCFYNYLVAIH